MEAEAQIDKKAETHEEAKTETHCDSFYSAKTEAVIDRLEEGKENSEHLGWHTS